MIHKTEASEYAKENLRRLMDERGVGVRELARLSENEPMAVSRILNHGRLPAVDCLLRISEALSVSINELFTPVKTKRKNSA